MDFNELWKAVLGEIELQVSKANFKTWLANTAIVDKKDERGWFSREICTGPHVSNTKEIGRFKIIKEGSVAAGVRRIKAILEKI